MFNIKLQFEDTALDFSSENGEDFFMLAKDVPTGDTYSPPAIFTWREVSKILELNLSPEGEADDSEEVRQRIDLLFKNQPTHLRPIP